MGLDARRPGESPAQDTVIVWGGGFRWLGTLRRRRRLLVEAEDLLVVPVMVVALSAHVIYLMTRSLVRIYRRVARAWKPLNDEARALVTAITPEGESPGIVPAPDRSPGTRL